MKATKLWAALTAILFFAVACSDDENPTGDYGTIQIANTQLLNQEVAADAEGAASVTFTAAESWSATVSETRAIDWITISPDHGEAGTYTLRIELLPNDSAEARTAVIEIICGENRVEIRIIQAGKEEENNEGGEGGDPVDRVPYPLEFSGPKIKSIEQYSLTADGQLKELESTWSFTYEHGLLSEAVQRWGDGAYDCEKYTFTYHENLANIKCEGWDQVEYGPSVGSRSSAGYEYYSYESIMVIEDENLDGRGRAVSAVSYWMGEEDESVTLEYDEDRLVRVNYFEDGADSGYLTWQWDGGSMVKEVDMYDVQEIVTLLTPYASYSNPFRYSQVDPVLLCQEEIYLLEAWVYGFCGDHNTGLYETIVSGDPYDPCSVHFEYEFGGGECMVNGNTVPLISRVVTSYDLSGATDSYRECYVFEYYE